MYESPIEVYTSKIDGMVQLIQKKQEEHIYEAVLNVGVNVNKEELVKALLYDRDQYDKGYQDGIEEFAEKLLEMCTQEGAYEYVSAYDIDNLKREMVGEKNV